MPEDANAYSVYASCSPFLSHTSKTKDFSTKRSWQFSFSYNHPLLKMIGPKAMKDALAV